MKPYAVPFETATGGSTNHGDGSPQSAPTDTNRQEYGAVCQNTVLGGQPNAG
jgi:hypothetical protein